MIAIGAVMVVLAAFCFWWSWRDLVLLFRKLRVIRRRCWLRDEIVAHLRKHPHLDVDVLALHLCGEDAGLGIRKLPDARRERVERLVFEVMDTAERMKPLLAPMVNEWDYTVKGGGSTSAGPEPLPGQYVLSTEGRALLLG